RASANLSRPTVRPMVRLVLPRPELLLLKMRVPECVPGGNVLALALRKTVMFVVAPTARTPPLAERENQFVVLPMSQLSGWPPVLASVYVVKEGVNGPPK